MFVDARLQISKSGQACSSNNKECLALSVWAKRGFHADKLEEIDERPVFRNCYRIPLNMKWEQQCDDYTRSQNIRVGNHPSPPPAAVIALQKFLKEQRQKEREQAREARLQEREKVERQKKQAAVAKKFHSTVVKARSNVSSLLHNNSFSAKDFAEGNRIKTGLTALGKKVRATSVGTGAEDVDEGACTELCSSADSWRKRVLEFQ